MTVFPSKELSTCVWCPGFSWLPPGDTHCLTALVACTGSCTPWDYWNWRDLLSWLPPPGRCTNSQLKHILCLSVKKAIACSGAWALGRWPGDAVSVLSLCPARKSPVSPGKELVYLPGAPIFVTAAQGGTSRSPGLAGQWDWQFRSSTGLWCICAYV